MIEMTLSSRHRIRNSNPGGLRPSTLPLGHGGRYLSVTEAPHNTNFHTWMGKKHFCFFQTAETGNRTPDSGVKGSGANHYPRAPALHLTCRSHVWSVSTSRCCVNSIQTRLFIGPALCQHWVKTSNPMLVYCWASVCDAGPTLHQHCFDVSCPSSRGH